MPLGSYSFTASVRGHLIPVAGGTRVEARIGLVPFFVAIVLFMGAGFLFAFILSIGHLLGGLRPIPPPTAIAWAFVGVALLLMAAFPAALFFVKWVDPCDVDFLKEVLARVLEPRSDPRPAAIE